MILKRFYYYHYYYYYRYSGSCTSSKHCNLQKALPLMAGLFYYQTHEMIFQRLCTTKCRGKCDYKRTFKTWMEDADLLITFAETMPAYWSSKWKPVLNEGISAHALSDVNALNNVVESNLEGIKYAQKQCSVAKSPNACKLTTLLEYHSTFKATIQRKDVKVKDIRKQSHVDYFKVVELQKENIHHMELLGGIKRLDDNLKASVKGIRKFFDGMAQFDKGIAKDNLEYINEELPTYKTTLASVEKRLVDDMNEAMGYMTGILASNLAAEIAKMAALIATNGNPLKTMIAGPDILDLSEQAEKIADATSQLVKGSRLLTSIGELKDDSIKVMDDFRANDQQMVALHKIAVGLSKTSDANDVGSDLQKDIDMFIIEYRKNAPVNRKHLLVKNNALWSAFKGAVCDVLNGDVSIAGAVLKSIAGAKLICERLEGTLAQFFSLKEELYDFTFQLADAINAIARGNLGQRFSAQIKGIHDDNLDGVDYFTGSYIFQTRVQKMCQVYCDILEYNNFGDINYATPCKPYNGVFTKRQLDDLISYKNNQPYRVSRRSVYLPTRSTTNGDTGVVDLQALARGETVHFKIPADRAWLMKYGWLSFTDSVYPFVKSLKLFLPHTDYDTWTQKYHSTTHVVMASVSGSSFGTGIVYQLSKASSSFYTTYEEGYHTCSNEIQNPYILCKDDPKICDKEDKVVKQDSLMPTIVSTWTLQANFTIGYKKITYDPPRPATNLLLRGETIMVLPSSKKKRSLSPRSKRVLATNNCCPGNMYRLDIREKTCGECPKGSTSVLGGLFCQID